jgi:hypothetical protein
MDMHDRRRGDGTHVCAHNRAGTVGGCGGKRARKERQGAYLSPQDRENLHRYGGNDDYGPSYGPYWIGDGYYPDYYAYDGPAYRPYRPYRY